MTYEIMKGFWGRGYNMTDKKIFPIQTNSPDQKGGF